MANELRATCSSFATAICSLTVSAASGCILMGTLVCQSTSPAISSSSATLTDKMQSSSSLQLYMSSEVNADVLPYRETAKYGFLYENWLQ